MLEIETKWGLTIDDFRQKAKQATHPRDHERWLALTWVAEGKSKVEVAQLLNRDYSTIINWINRYNEKGPGGLTYQPPRGQKSWLTNAQRNQLRTAMLKSPSESDIDGISWTYKQVIQYCKKYFQLDIKQGAAFKYIHQMGFTRKRPKQRYGKASNEKKRIRRETE